MIKKSLYILASSALLAGALTACGEAFEYGAELTPQPKEDHTVLRATLTAIGYPSTYVGLNNVQIIGTQIQLASTNSYTGKIQLNQAAPQDLTFTLSVEATDADLQEFNKERSTPALGILPSNLISLSSPTVTIKAGEWSGSFEVTNASNDGLKDLEDGLYISAIKVKESSLAEVSSKHSKIYLGLNKSVEYLMPIELGNLDNSTEVDPTALQYDPQTTYPDQTSRNYEKAFDFSVWSAWRLRYNYTADNSYNRAQITFPEPLNFQGIRLAYSFYGNIPSAIRLVAVMEDGSTKTLGNVNLSDEAIKKIDGVDEYGSEPSAYWHIQLYSPLRCKAIQIWGTPSYANYWDIVEAYIHAVD